MKIQLSTGWNPKRELSSAALLIVFFAATASDSLAKSKSAVSADFSQNTVSKSTPINMVQIGQRLNTSGLQGEIHAADPANHQFVFTYRDPNDFFNNVQFVMSTDENNVGEAMDKLCRHDQVLLQGEFFHQGGFADESPQMHIKVKKIRMLKHYEAPLTATEKFRKTTKLPDELRDKSKADFLVHAVPKGGEVLVLEYKDNFVFVVVPDKRFTEKLYRNDRIHMRFHLQKFPSQPTHLELDTDTSDGKKPIEIIDSIAALHGKLIVQKGALVRFPKSPQIIRDVWAIEQKGDSGNSRTFTLVNFDSAGEQARIDAKLKTWWDDRSNRFVDARNKLLSTTITIRAKGIMNVVDPNQANAQMKLKSKDIKRLSN